MIYAFGDSFVQGCQDNAVDSYEEYRERYEISFVSKLANALKTDFKNYAIRGSSNFVQLDILLDKVKNIKPDDIVLFGITSSVRDRPAIVFNNQHIVADDSPSNLVWKKIGCLTNRIASNDFYFTISVLNQIEKDFKLKIVKFNTFENQLLHLDGILKPDINVTDFIGFDVVNNTLFDIVNDSYGFNNEGLLVGSTINLQVSKKMQIYFTAKKHPNHAGHQKIADWFLKNIFS